MEKIKLEDCSGIYVCEKGDTLESVAKKFSTTERIIWVENNLQSEIVESAILLVKKGEKVYEVEIEDTLESIRCKLNVNIDLLLSKNYVNYIYPTQKLQITKE